MIKTILKIKNIALKNKKAFLVILSVLILSVFAIALLLLSNSKPKADTEYLNALVQRSSELTTAKLNYTGMTEFTDTGINFINKSDFIMVYQATIRAGINVEDVKVTAEDAEKNYLHIYSQTANSGCKNRCVINKIF